MAEGLTPKQAEDVLNLVDEISKFIKENQHRVPYQLNLIDEMHINENGHSRILSKLLQYQSTDRKFIFLQSLFEYIAERYENCASFKNIIIEEPIFPKPDTCRIDLWVLNLRHKNLKQEQKLESNKCAVIFENKIYKAGDQTKQLERYIERTKEKDYKETGIFVIYLPPTDDINPTRQTWGKYWKETTIRTKRYAKASFESVILPWLKEKVLPEIPRKDEMLECAVVQYIDYLEGLSGVREYDKMINNMVHNNIKEHLNCKDEQPGNNISQLEYYRDNISKLLIELIPVFCENLEKRLSMYNCIKNWEWGNSRTSIEAIFQFYEAPIYLYIWINAEGMTVNLQNDSNMGIPKKITTVTDKKTGEKKIKKLSPLCSLLMGILTDFDSVEIEPSNKDNLYKNNIGSQFIAKSNMKWTTGANFLDELLNKLEENNNDIEKLA